MPNGYRGVKREVTKGMSECADWGESECGYGASPRSRGKAPPPHNQRGAIGICSKRLPPGFDYQHYKRIWLHFSFRTRAYVCRYGEKLMCLFIDRHGAR